jgi:acetyl-CoA carboxylase carboxyltransferase component
MARLGWRKAGRPPAPAPAPPLHDVEDLLGLAPGDLKTPFDPREVVARVVDGSEFDEFKPLYGPSLLTGRAAVHGYPVGILANVRGVLFNAEAQKAGQFIQLANRAGVPLLFLQNTTGYMVGRDYEAAGIIKHGAQMINAVANSTVPHITVTLGASYGAGNYGMCGRSFNPRFLFTWPNSRTAVMGPAQLAGVMSIVARQSAESRGLPFDEAADAQRRIAAEAQIEAESLALAMSGRLYDDGVIDPRDTRTVLAIALSAVHSAAVEGARTYGVFRL